MESNVLTTWEIQINLWEDESLNNKYQVLFNEIANELTENIPTPPVLGYKLIDLGLDEKFGPTIYWPLQSDRYRIALNIQPEEYAKAVFQFAHQLCHLYVDPRVNNWFIESICQMTAYYFLEKFANRFDEHNIPKGFTSKGETFDEFFKERVKFVFDSVDLMQHQHSSNWLKREVKALVCDKVWDSVLNDVVAFEILPLFKSQEVYWQLIRYFGKSTNPPPPSEITNLSSSSIACPDFELLRNIVPPGLLPAVDNIINKVWK